jgi:Dolichyl-phosphate-mannose-protein mannosyltransferase
VSAVGLVLGAAAAGLRLPPALGDAFWQDEVASARVIREPTFGAMLHQVVRTESTPPLWYTLAWLTHRAGVSIHDVRLLSVVFDGLLVYAAVQLAAKMMPLQLAAVVGALLAVSGQLSFHGRELRAYELYVLLVALFALALHASAALPTARRLAVLAATTAVGMLTHYFFAFTLAAGLVWLWTDPRVRSARLRVTGAVAVALAICAPWLPMFAAQYRHDRFSWIRPFDGREVLETPLLIFSPALATVTTAAVFLALILGGAWVAYRQGPLERLCAALAVLPLLFAAATWLAGAHVYNVRNMIGIAPFVATLAILPLASLPGRGRVAAAAAVAAVAVFAFAVGQTPNPPFGKIAAALVHDGWRPHDAVLVDGSFDTYRSPLEWYLPDARVFVARPMRDLSQAATFAVLPRRALPRGDERRATRVGSYVVGRFPVRIEDRWLRRGVLLAPVTAALRT